MQELVQCPCNNHTVCHSVLDTESTVPAFWIPVLPLGKDATGERGNPGAAGHHPTPLVTSFVTEIMATKHW